MPKKNKGNIKAGQRGRADENNDRAIGKLLADAEAAKKVWDKKSPEWREANPFIFDQLLAVARITAWPATESFTIVTPSGRTIQTRGLDKAIAHIVAQACKECKQTQAGSDVWPSVVVSLPEPHASSQVGEIIALLDPDQVPQFAKLGFEVTGGQATEADFFDRSEPAAGGGSDDEEELDISTI